jgi:hypothetical protein
VLPQVTQHSTASPTLYPLRSPSLMPTVPHRTLETIGRIITLAYPPEPYPWSAEWRARRRFLRATSLVCRDWTPFAQAELWKSVRLRWNESERFAVAGPGRHPVLTLVLGQTVSSDARLADEILLGVRGVRKLEIMNGSYDSRCLCGPGFRG